MKSAANWLTENFQELKSGLFRRWNADDSDLYYTTAMIAELYAEATLEPFRAVLAEAWETLSAACEYDEDPQYHLDVPAVRELMQRIHAVNQGEHSDGPQPRPVQPPRVPFCPIPCPNCGKAESVNWNCSNHIILNGEIYGK